MTYPAQQYTPTPTEKAATKQRERMELAMWLTLGVCVITLGIAAYFLIKYMQLVDALRTGLGR